MKNVFKNYWPILSYLGIIIVLFITNYQPGTYLTGWDNLHPEYNFSINIKRSLFAVWQEYQGLGLLGGMGHASDLLRQLFLLLLSFVFPPSILRYFWVFLMLLTGVTGAYFFIRYLIASIGLAGQKNIIAGHASLVIQISAFLGGLFYLFNLSTMQTFYAPFEAFIAHYGFLPWMLLASILFIKTTSYKHLLFLTLVLLLATPASYIPTLFLVYLMALTVLLTVFFIHALVKDTVFYFLKKSFLLFVIIIFVNAFWLLPFAYFTLTNVSVNLNSKINQMATETIYEQNKEFGHLEDVFLLKGFWFNNVDPNKEGSFEYMLAPWRIHLQNPVIPALGYTFVLVMGIGILASVRRRDSLSFSLITLFIFVLTMMTTATPPFSIIHDFLREHIALFNQAFRFPFTKFSVLTSLSYAIFFGLGMHVVLKKIQRHNHNSFHVLSAVGGFVFVLFVLYCLPFFQAHFLYDKQRLKIPKDYFDTFSYFAKKDPSARIANFPQHTLWGWEFYRWGYGGSGFLWYGIHAPILDRAFDVWSKTSENYYYELANALYAKDAKAFEAVLQKYQIKYLLVDRNVFDPVVPKVTFIKELETLLSEIPSVKKDQTLGQIAIYSVEGKDQTNSFVFQTSSLNSANSYLWGNNDVAYKTLGNYVALPSKQEPTVFFPFRSLFTGKTQNDVSFLMRENESEIELVTLIPKSLKPTYLQLPPLTETETILPAILSTQLERDEVAVIVTIQTPEITVGNQKVYGEKISQTLYSIPNTASFPLRLNINGSDYTISQKEEVIGTTFLSLKEDNRLVLTDSQKTIINDQVIPTLSLHTIPLLSGKTIQLPNREKEEKMTVKIRKITDPSVSTAIVPKSSDVVPNCDRFTDPTQEKDSAPQTAEQINKRFIAFSSKNATSCSSFFTNSLSHDLSYAVFINHQNIKGRGFHFWLLNEDQKYAPLDTYLPAKKNVTTSAFILSPQEAFGKAYSFHFENIAIGQTETINTLSGMSVYPLPYNFLTTLLISPETSPAFFKNTSQPVANVSHPNESLYLIQLDAKSHTLNPVLVLSQSYDPGWKAYYVNRSNNVILNSPALSKANVFQGLFPFFFGKEIKTHMLVNNWENGWDLSNYMLDDKRYTLVIVYLPQYLEYEGFLMLFFLLLWLIVHGLTMKKTITHDQ